MKKTHIVFIILILTVGILSAKNLLVKIALEKSISKMSGGLKLSIKNMDIGILSPSIRVEGLTLFNPRNYDDNIMFEIPLLYLKYDISSIFRNRIHIMEMALHLKCLNVIKNRDGALNISYLNITRPKKGKDVKMPMSRILIDKLHLKAGKVTYKDYAQPPFPNVLEYDIDLDERYENIKDPYALGSLIVSRSLIKTNISRLTGFDLGPLQDEISGVVGKGLRVSQELTSQGRAALERTKDVLKGALKFPFGGDDERQ